jgi:uncharacterized protein YidB (DUF937 family)
MGLLDQVTGALGGAKSGGVTAMLVQQLIGMLSKPGALGQLTTGAQQNGLGNIVQSWIGKGQNLPISGEQVQRLLGTGTVAEMAQNAGVSTPDAADALSGVLPNVIDKISPDGKEPGTNDLGSLLSSVGKMFH